MTQVQQRKRPSPYLKHCPRCGVIIPINIKGCWSCGKVLNPHLIELAERAGVKP